MNNIANQRAEAHLNIVDFNRHPFVYASSPSSRRLGRVGVFLLLQMRSRAAVACMGRSGWSGADRGVQEVREVNLVTLFIMDVWYVST